MNKKDRKELSAYRKAKSGKRLFVVPDHLAYSGAGDDAFLVYGGEVTEVVHCGLIIDADGQLFIGLACDDKIFPFREPDPEHDTEEADWCTNSIDVPVSEIGKTLFFSREEAERKIVEMEEKE